MSDRIKEIRALYNAAQNEISRINGHNVDEPCITISMYNAIDRKTSEPLRTLASRANSYVPHLLGLVESLQRENERLEQENTAMRDSVLIATGVPAFSAEYAPVTFCGFSATEAIQILQRAREKQEPKPLEFNQLKVGNPVWVEGLHRWEIISGINAEWMKITLRCGVRITYGHCNLYASEPLSTELIEERETDEH